MEEGIAKTLGWKMGDALTFTVGGESFTARITLDAQAALGLDEGELLRHRPAGLIGRFPASYISAFRLAAGDEPRS